MNNLEEKLNKALELIGQGLSEQEVLLKFPDDSKELAPLLSISQSLFALPKNPVPTPLMQKKFALVPEKNLWFAWMHISKLASISVSVMLVFGAVAVTGLTAYNSEPGQTMFQVKKLAEKSQFLLAYNQDQKANIQLEITKKRLSEATAILNNPTSNPEQQKAAVDELASQADTAAEAVKTAAITDPKSSESQPLIQTLENINVQQKQLVENIKDDKVKSLANNALNANSEKVSKIVEELTIASNEDDVASAILPNDPNAITALGEISQISKTQITVEKTTFVITTQTVIKDSKGNKISTADLQPKMKISILGKKASDQILADQVLLVQTPESEGEVKSASTTTLTETEFVQTTSTTSNSGKIDFQNPVLKPDPSQATAGFILEMP